jgi:hypothetical protein
MNPLTENLTLTAGFTFQKQDLEHYREVKDLLGGNYFLDLNQFADLTNPNDSNGLQNDLNNPNRKLGVGDKYGYDFIAHIQRSNVWAQGSFKYDRFDFFIAAQLDMTQYYRTGKVRNGVFRDISFGDSEKQSFTDPSVKGGISYKYNGRNYFYVNGAFTSRAPLFRNAFISPNTRNTTIADLQSEKAISTEGGYLLRAPRFKVRATGYYTKITDQTASARFYHGDFKTFVNYNVTGIDRNHVGMELAADASLGKGFGATAVVAMGQFTFDSRPLATISQDNKDTLLAENETVYFQNLRLGGFPQNVYSFGLSYRSPNFWYVYANLNYYNNFYVQPNPSRRTLAALDLVNEGTDQWNEILSQEKLDGQLSVDLSVGWSWKMNNKFKSLKKNTFIVFNLGVTNILNNKNMNITAYEQLRFDSDMHDINSFPSKYAYAFGTTYFASIALRIN